MKSTVIRKGITASVILGLGALLSACGGGGGGGSAASSGSTPTNNNVITGYTEDGYFSANVYVYGFNNSSATLCNSGISSSNGSFSISLGSCSGPYLVVATASSGTDAGTYYYFTNQTSNPIYVTPASTVIVEEQVRQISQNQVPATTMLSLISSNSTVSSSITSLENNYNNGSISFVPVSVPNGSNTIEYIYPSLNSATIPILVKGFNGNSTSVETAFGYFSSGTLYLQSNTNSSSSFPIPLSSSITPVSLSQITSSSYSSITSILSPTPMIMPVTSSTQTPNPITSSSSVIPTSNPSPIITPTSSPITGATTGNTFSTYMYEDPGTFNVPMVTIYVDGQPVNLVVDTGDSGLLVNQTAVNIPSSDYTNYQIRNLYGSGSSYSGLIASATVCINPSITSSCVVMPIGVVTSGNIFPGIQSEGVFGLASGLNTLSIGISPGGNDFYGYSYPYYLEQNTGINSYTLSFYSLLNGYYANISQTKPIGEISFGPYVGNSNTLITYNDNNEYFPPSASIIFGTSYTDTVTFDTASPYNYLNPHDLYAAIPGYSQNQDENDCPQYSNSAGNVVNGSFTISYTIQSYTGSFVTEPSASFCNNPPPFNLMTGITIDNIYGGSFPISNVYLGLPAMLGHTFTFVLGNVGTPGQYFVQYLGISP